MGVKNIRQIERKAPSAREMLVAPFSLSALSLPPLSLFGGLSVLDDVTAKNAVSKGKGRRGREHADDDDEDSAREKEREGRKWLFFLLCIQRPSPSRGILLVAAG